MLKLWCEWIMAYGSTDRATTRDTHKGAVMAAARGVHPGSAYARHVSPTAQDATRGGHQHICQVHEGTLRGKNRTVWMLAGNWVSYGQIG